MKDFYTRKKRSQRTNRITKKGIKKTNWAKRPIIEEKTKQKISIKFNYTHKKNKVERKRAKISDEKTLFTITWIATTSTNDNLFLIVYYNYIHKVSGKIWWTIPLHYGIKNGV